MKPRTKLQFEVLDLSSYLPKIENKMLDWAKVSVLKHIGYATKNRVICMDCGESFSPEVVKRKRATCPHCNQKLVVEQSRKSTMKQQAYVAISKVVDEFQVIRNFEIYSYHKVGKETRYFVMEILQHWYLNEKKREVVARNHTLNSYVDSWNGDMEIRKNYNSWYYSSTDKYDIYPDKYHPDSEFRPEFTKYGINHNLRELSFLEAVKILPKEPQAETLIKAKQYGLLRAFRRSEGNKVRRHWDSIKICMRNKYYSDDSGLYFDYLDLLYYFQKDLRNAHYVCPKDLRKQHDKLMNKKRAVQKKLDEEDRKRRAIENEKAFKELKAKFFGLSFTDGFIHIKVLESVEEYVEEGDKLKHCVFTNNYFSKPGSICLSARIENEPVETIELSLKDFKILQCRGKHNKDSEHHDRIIKLMNKNIRKIKQLTKLNQSA